MIAFLVCTFAGLPLHFCGVIITSQLLHRVIIFMHDCEQSTCAKPVRQSLTTVVVGLQGDDEGYCQDGDKMSNSAGLLNPDFGFAYAGVL